jgi:hypothetical protein
MSMPIPNSMAPNPPAWDPNGSLERDGLKQYSPRTHNSRARMAQRLRALEKSKELGSFCQKFAPTST